MRFVCPREQVPANGMIQCETQDGLKLLVVRPLDEEGKETGTAVVSADAVGAGPDEVVLIAAGSSARQTSVTDKRPIDSVILAIVDSWYVGNAVKYKK